VILQVVNLVDSLQTVFNMKAGGTAGKSVPDSATAPATGAHCTRVWLSVIRSFWLSYESWLYLVRPTAWQWLTRHPMRGAGAQATVLDKPKPFG